MWWCKRTQDGWKSTQFEYCTHIRFTINIGTQFEQQYWLATKQSLTLTTILMHHAHTKYQL